jgi:hypothetical protein
MAFGVQAQLGHCHQHNPDETLQRWLFIQPEEIDGNPITEGGNKVYWLFNLAAGRCLGVTATQVGQPLILTNCGANNTAIALWELRPTTPASRDFQLALWLFDDWRIAANDFNDNIPTRLGLAGCAPSDTRQLRNLG